MKKIVFSSVCLLSGLLNLYAQDPQFSQFYANPLYQNPAFAGSALMNRVVLNYRYQWPNLNANYMTYAASYDRFFEKVNSGLGVQVMNDQQAFGSVNSLNVTLAYSYQLQLSRTFSYRHGIQIGYAQRSLSYAGLTFGTQFDPNTQTFNTGNPSGENFTANARRYVDVGTGGLFYNSRFYFGYALHHLTRPNQGVTDGIVDRLPIKIQLQVGWKIPLDFETRKGLAENVTDGEKSITPVLLYKQQGPFNQLDAGVYFTIEPMVFGFWYRGLPVRPKTLGLNNSDAAVALIGYKWQGLSIGYSYDATLSNLGLSTGGSHEISVTYEWSKVKKERRFQKYNPCPRF
jgi:type IX secretion system PorP/SprF family membrane protein